MAKRSVLRTMLLGIGCATLSAATLFTGPAALAAPAAPAAHQYCMYDTDTQRSGCFASQQQAVLWATGGRTSDENAMAQSAGAIIKGRFFKDKNFGGDMFTVYGDHLCNPADGKINGGYTFPASWQNVITSVEPYGNCKIWLYPQPHLTGDRDGPFLTDTGDIGPFMNNRTKSVGFS